ANFDGCFLHVAGESADRVVIEPLRHTALLGFFQPFVGALVLLEIAFVLISVSTDLSSLRSSEERPTTEGTEVSRRTNEGVNSCSTGTRSSIVTSGRLRSWARGWPRVEE